jgi:hypothetical protein
MHRAAYIVDTKSLMNAFALQNYSYVTATGISCKADMHIGADYL